MLKFSPAIFRPSATTEFPQPVQVFRMMDTWDFEKMKVPLRDGDQIAGHSRQGVEIAIEGQIGKHSGELKLTEPEMLLTLQTLREAFNVDSAADQYSLILFADEPSSDYRYFKSCTTTRFEFDLSNQHLYSFAATIHAADPTLYAGMI